MTFARTYRIVTTAVLVPVLASCAMMGTVIGSAKDTMKIAGGCPDLSSMDAISKVDFAAEFSFDPAAAGKVKAAVIAASALKDISTDIDADLKTGCGGLAKDLGDATVFKTGKEACTAAVKAMDAAKAKLGAKVTVALEIKPPSCSVSLDLVGDCAGKCDASLKGGKAEATCEGGEVSGTCDGDCSGKCELKGAATCAGNCAGSCDADFSGTCRGTCEGECDNKKKSDGACAGKCQGKCDTDGSGTCGGKCSGTCELSSASKCEGTCSGTCSVALKSPTCSGTVVPPKMSAECKSSCDAKANAGLVCTPASVAVKITGAKDVEAAAKLAAALETNLPRILKIAIAMVERVPAVLKNAKETVEGGIAIAKSVSSARATASAHIGQCLLEPFEGAVSGIVDIEASVKVSVDVKESASASASGTAG